MEFRDLYRSESDRVVAGICGGIAEVYDVPVWAVRFVFVFGWVIYLIGWATIPTESEFRAKHDQAREPQRGDSNRHSADRRR